MDLGFIHQALEALKAGVRLGSVGLFEPWYTAICWNEYIAVVVKTVLGSHFGAGEFTTHLRAFFSGDWDVHCF